MSRGIRYDARGRARHVAQTMPDDGVRYIYFIQPEAGGPVKIGKSRDPKRRLREAQTHHPERLVIRRTVRVHKAYVDVMERNLHKHFADHRLNGEWFDPTPELTQLGHLHGWTPQATDGQQCSPDSTLTPTPA
jgi:hypothetical protein